MLTYSARYSVSNLHWCPYPYSTSLIFGGLVSLRCGIVYFLISVGSQLSLWKTIGSLFIGSGLVCVILGGIMCTLSVQKTKMLRQGVFAPTAIRFETDFDTYMSEAVLERT